MRQARAQLGRAAAVLAAALASATPVALPEGRHLDPAALSADNFTVPAPLDETAAAEAYQQPAPILTGAQLEQFLNGRKGFAQRWVVAPSITGLWGRGPTSNGEACTDCHEHGGRGTAPEYVTQPMVSMLVRLSVPGADAYGGPNPHFAYGDQLQNQGILGRVPPEGDPRLEWRTQTVAFADGEVVTVRAPVLDFWHLSFGTLGPEVMTSARVAPALVGVGLLDAVPESALHALAQERQRQGLGGRVNRVRDMINGRAALGRFGYKANQPSLQQQIVTAYHADLGVSSRWFPEENCTETQTRCRMEPPGGHPELPDLFLDPVLFYARALAVPARRDAGDPQVLRGQALFALAGCDGCHAPELRTGDYAALPALSQQTIQPYTDLLLHDMGDGLADGRPDYEAGGRDWRTAPLWGLGLSQAVNGNATLLHDGRARNAAEAILWHGGEAQAAREAFRTMDKADRAALLAFLHSL